MLSPGKSPVTAAEGVSEGKKSSSESLESAGLVGKKHPAAKMQEMLGLDQYKKAMAGLWHCHSKQWQQVCQPAG